jgi:uncharacterized membrane protein YkvA (DUF1232 family)
VAAVSVTTLLIVAGVLIAVYATVLLALAAAGRGAEASALARFVPDCVVLVKRLLGDPRVPVESKVILGLLVIYLASPIDLVPDFIPVAGQLDDAILLAIALRHLVRRSGTRVVAEHWPGPVSTLNAVLLLSGAPVR